jgi:hypothetical protein
MGFSDMEEFHAKIYGCSKCNTVVGHRIDCEHEENPKDELRNILIELNEHFKNKSLATNNTIPPITIERSHNVILFDGSHQWNLKALGHHAWNRLTLDILDKHRINIFGFKFDKTDTAVWCDVYCKNWLNRTYGDKVYL